MDEKELSEEQRQNFYLQAMAMINDPYDKSQVEDYINRLEEAEWSISFTELHFA